MDRVYRVGAARRLRRGRRRLERALARFDEDRRAEALHHGQGQRERRALETRRLRPRLPHGTRRESEDPGVDDSRLGRRGRAGHKLRDKCVDLPLAPGGGRNRLRRDDAAVEAREGARQEGLRIHLLRGESQGQKPLRAEGRGKRRHRRRRSDYGRLLGMEHRVEPGRKNDRGGSHAEKPGRPGIHVPEDMARRPCDETETPRARSSSSPPRGARRRTSPSRIFAAT
jgi:hypothetical protein